VPYEHIVFDGNPLANKAVTLDLAVLTDDAALLDLHERPYLGVVADAAAIEVDEVRSIDVLAVSNGRGDVLHQCKKRCKVRGAGSKVKRRNSRYKVQGSGKKV
jgi:hypothetical protein